MLCRICKGSIKSLLPILHYVFLSFSREFAEFVSDKGYSLAGKNDLRFVEGIGARAFVGVATRNL